MNPSDAIQDKILTHAHYLAMYENGQLSELLAVLQKAHEELLAKIALSDGPWTKAMLERTLQQVDSLYSQAVAQMNTTLQAGLQNLAVYETKWIVDGMGNVLANMPQVAFNNVSPSLVWAAITTSPVDRGHLMADLMSKYSDATVDGLKSAIRQGIVEGESIPKMIARLRGTYASGYTNGVFQTSARGAETIVRTMVMHVSNTSQTEVYRANAGVIKGLKWKATLDDRTCMVCGAMDGRTMGVEDYPMPPMHFQCRCVRTPIVLGFPLRKVSYADWIKGIPAKQQDEILGPVRARMMREGVPLNRFVNNGHKLTLDEMKTLDS